MGFPGAWVTQGGTPVSKGKTKGGTTQGKGHTEKLGKLRKSYGLSSAQRPESGLLSLTL